MIRAVVTVDVIVDAIVHGPRARVEDDKDELVWVGFTVMVVVVVEGARVVT